MPATRRGNQFLCFDALVHALLEGWFGFLFLAEHDAAVHLLDQALAHQRLDVAAYGFIGHLELLRQFDDGTGAARFHRGKYFILSFLQPHSGSCLDDNRVGSAGFATVFVTVANKVTTR